MLDPCAGVLFSGLGTVRKPSCMPLGVKTSNSVESCHKTLESVPPKEDDTFRMIFFSYELKLYETSRCLLRLRLEFCSLKLEHVPQ